MTFSLFDGFFIGITLVYFWFGSKVDQWVTISTLGFKLETPQRFLENPRIYDVIRSVLFLTACVCLLGTELIHWYMGAGILAAAWLATTWIGQRIAFSTYRQIWQEGVDEATTPEEKAPCVIEAKRSNSELRNRIPTLQNIFARR
jgi:hypothetical protein